MNPSFNSWFILPYDFLQYNHDLTQWKSFMTQGLGTKPHSREVWYSHLHSRVHLNIKMVLFANKDLMDCSVSSQEVKCLGFCMGWVPGLRLFCLTWVGMLGSHPPIVGCSCDVPAMFLEPFAIGLPGLP